MRKCRDSPRGCPFFLIRTGTSPVPTESLKLLGKDEAVNRIQKAIELILTKFK